MRDLVGRIYQGFQSLFRPMLMLMFAMCTVYLFFLTIVASAYVQYPGLRASENFKLFLTWGGMIFTYLFMGFYTIVLMCRANAIYHQDMARYDENWPQARKRFLPMTLLLFVYHGLTSVWPLFASIGVIVFFAHIGPLAYTFAVLISLVAIIISFLFWVRLSFSLYFFTVERLPVGLALLASWRLSRGYFGYCAIGFISAIFPLSLLMTIIIAIIETYFHSRGITVFVVIIGSLATITLYLSTILTLVDRLKARHEALSRH